MLNHLRFSLGCLALTWLSLTVSVMGMDPTGESAREDVASIGTAGSDDDQPPAQEKPGAGTSAATQERRNGVLRRLRERMDNPQQQAPPAEGDRLGDRLKDRLGVDPESRLLPELLKGLEGNGNPNAADGKNLPNPGDGVPASGVAPLTSSPQIVSAEAVIGTQYNIGHVVFRLAPEDMVRWQARAVFITDAEDRSFYPAMMPSFMDRVTSQMTDPSNNQPRDINIWFLFTGRQPLDMTIHATADHTVRLEPTAVRRLRQRLVTQSWWRQFNAMLEEQSQASDYPPLVQAYLGSMVQQRMGMSLPLLQRQKAEPADPLTATWYLLTGAEDLQVESMRELMDGTADVGPSNLPLPENIAWRPHQFPDLGQVPVEEIASVVPHECFYLRFGTWQNQIWLKKLMEEHGGDLSRMVRLRGYQSMVGDIFGDQLALQSSQLDDMLGGTLIQDVAVIGLDTFFNDGAAAGIVFQAKNGLLKTNMDKKRRDFAKANADKGMTLEPVQVGQAEGSLLQSPDGKVRSLMVHSGNFILVTTSFSLAQRFLEAGNGERTLAASREFQNARIQMPLTRDDTIFFYLSTAFLENLLSPHYQIELKRRLRSITEIQALQLASWTAMSQGMPTPDGQADWDLVPLPNRIDALVEAGLLPKSFNQRPDGSRLGLMQDLNWEVEQESEGTRPIDAGERSDVAPGELELFPGGGSDPEAAPSNDGQKGEKPPLEAPGKGNSQSLGASLLGSVGGFFGAGQSDKDSAEPPSVMDQAAGIEGRQASSDAPVVKQVSLEQSRSHSPVGGLLYGDTHRGVRGWMVPVADMPLQQVTAAEQEWYRQRAQYFAENWGQTDPIMLGVKRFRLDDNKERVIFDGRVAPFGSQKYSWLTDNIGPPMTTRPSKSPDDVIRLEVSIGEGALLPSVSAHQLFASVQRDAQQLSSVDPGEWWTTLKLLQDTPGYIGSWPTAGWLDMLPMLGGRPDAEGFTHSIGRQVWRMQHEGFSVVATSRERLEQLRPYLTTVEAEHPAQLRLEVSDLNDTQMAGWTNALWRQRSWQASVANTRLLHLLMQYFRLPPEQAKQKAQSLLNARLVCSLDGDYQLRGPVDEQNPAALTPQVPVAADPFDFYWVSDRWPQDSQLAAEVWSEEQSPLLKWFRGALLEVLQEDQRFLVHGYLDIQRGVKETAALPGINLFKGFSFK